MVHTCYTCELCSHIFLSKQAITNHINRKKKCYILNDENAKILEKMVIDYDLDLNLAYICQMCQCKFTQKSSLKYHMDTIHFISWPDLNSSQSILNFSWGKLSQELSKYVILVGKLNYYDLFVDLIGRDITRRLLLECVLGDINFDCKILNKIYLDNNPKFCYNNIDNASLIYENQEGHYIVENVNVLIQMLASNLQDTYSKLLRWVTSYQIINGKYPYNNISEYEIDVCNQHIIKLSEPKYWELIVSKLKIPPSEELLNDISYLAIKTP
jgi:hypothetical protein